LIRVFRPARRQQRNAAKVDELMRWCAAREVRHTAATLH
jgi:hypothetical protein